MAYIIQKHPQYVLISADHPNKKVRMLPKMLVQAFPVRVIGFAEKGTGISTKNLHEMNLEYNLYPPVSGPAIERTILKMLKDDELRAQQEAMIKTTRSGDSAAGGNELITFKGETPGPDSMKSSFEQARAALSQLVSSDGNQDDSQIETTASSSMMNFQQQGSPGADPLGPAYRGGIGQESASGSAYQPASSEDPSSNTLRTSQQAQDSQTGFHDGNSNWSPHSAGSSSERDFENSRRSRSDQGSGVNKSSGRDDSKRGAEQDHSANPESDAYDSHSKNRGRASGLGSGTNSDFESESKSSHGMDEDSNSSRGKSGSSDTSPIGEGDSHGSTSENDPTKNTESDSRSGRSKKDGLPVMESEYVPRNAPAPYRMQQENEAKDLDGTTSIFVRGAQTSLNESVNLKGSETAEEITQSSNLACITVESPRFSGYLVCAMGRDRKIDKTFIDVIKQRL
ncbi:MAG: hypothetical protein ACXWC9_00285, partial [Pseudobdellovibrionaceae bacterium]